MKSKDAIIQNLLRVVDRLIIIAYNAGGRSEAILKQLEEVNIVRDKILVDIED